MRFVLSFIFSILFTTSLCSQTLVWTLEGVTFDDGGVAAGSFEIDYSTNTLVDWNVSVSGGNETAFPPFTYSAGSSFSQPAPFRFGPILRETSTLRQLRLTTIVNLPRTGGTIPLDIGGIGPNARECFDCNPSRLITGGRLQAPSTTHPPTQWSRADGGNGHYYQVVPLVGSWTEANDLARTLSFQGYTAHLVTITNSAEQNFVESLLPGGQSFSANYWVGLTDRDTEGTFAWVTREPVDFTHWAEGEPNDFGDGEDAAALRWEVECQGSDCVSTGEWNDLADSGEQGFERLGPFSIIEFEVGAGPHELHIAQFGTGQTLQFDLVVFNRSRDNMAWGRALFWDPQGNRVRPTSFLDRDSFFLLPPQASTTFRSTGEGGLVTGSLVITSDHPVGAIVRFFLPNAGLAGIGSAEPQRAVIVSVRREGALSSGVAIRNASETPITVDLTLKGEDGEVVENGTATRDLTVNGRVSEFIEQYFPGADTASFSGTVCVEARSGKIVVVGLELEVGGDSPKFTALPVVPLN